MAGSASRSLFIQIGGSASDLTIAAKAGKSALLDLGAGAEDVQATVRGAFEKLGGNVADQAKAMEDAYSRSFANIRSTAQAALRAPTPAGTGVVLDLSAARQEADQAQASATFLRTLSDAQTKLVESGAEASTGARSLAVSLELQALAAEKNALASVETVAGLSRLAAASGIATEELNEVSGGHTRVGATGLIADHVVRAFSDSIAAGQSPIRAFALELPRITEALQLMSLGTEEGEGALAKFAGFMGGPWGLAITLGASVLGPLVANLIESGHAADDAKRAEQDYAKALEGVGDAVDKANGKLVERNRLLGAIALQEKRPEIVAAQNEAKTNSAQAFNVAKAAAAPPQASAGATGSFSALPAYRDPAQVQFASSVQHAIASADGDVIKLRNNLNTLALQASGPNKAGLEKLADTVNHLAGMSVVASQKATQLRDDAAATSTVLGGGSILTAESIRRAATDKAATTPLDKARARVQDVDAQIRDVGAEAVSPKQQAELAKLAQQYDAATAAVKRLEAAQREANANRQVGRQIDISQAEAIVQGIGGTVTSAQRSTAKQAQLYAAYQNGTGSLAAKPGTSLHETGQALDVAKTAGISLASLKKAFEDAGVHLTEALDEGNHYHVGFGPKGARGPSADTLARRQLAAADKGVNQDDAFQNELRSATDAVGAARDKLPQTADERYATDTGKADDDFIQRDSGLVDKVGAGKLTAANALVLEQLYAQLADLQKQGAAITRDTAISDQRFALDAAALDAQQELLKLDEQLAPTREARLKLEQQILAGQQQAYRAQLDRDIANARTNPEAAQKAVIAYQSIDKREAGQNADLNRQYAAPGQTFVRQLDSTSLNDSLQGAAVQGLGHLSDGLEGVIDGTKSVSAAFSEMGRSIIADLVKIAVQQAIIKPLATSLFGGTGSGGGGISSLLASLGIGRGSPTAVTSAGAAADDTTFMSILGLADGGAVAGPGTARSDSIPAMLSHGEFVVNAGAAGKHLTLLRAINDNKVSRFADGGYVGGGSITGGLPAPAQLSTVEMRQIRQQPQAPVVIQVQANDYFDAKVANTSAAQINAASPHIAAGGAQLANTNAARARRRAL